MPLVKREVVRMKYQFPIYTTPEPPCDYDCASLAEPELLLVLSSCNAPEHPCDGARARARPSMRAVPAMQSLGTRLYVSKMLGSLSRLSESLQAASAKEQVRFCPQKLPFFLLALDGRFNPAMLGHAATMLGKRHTRCNEPASKLIAWHQIFSRSYRYCHGIRTATYCRTLRIAASLRPYLVLSLKSIEHGKLRDRAITNRGGDTGGLKPYADDTRKQLFELARPVSLLGQVLALPCAWSGSDCSRGRAGSGL